MQFETSTINHRFNIEKQCLTYNNKVHQGRIWSVKACTPQTYATSADDGTVKLWDIRQKNLVATFDKHPGRVSNILPLTASTIVVSSCPDVIVKTQIKASFTVWDCRR